MRGQQQPHRPPQVDRDDIKQKEGCRQVADMIACAACADWKLLSLTEKRSFWDAVAGTDIDLILGPVQDADAVLIVNHEDTVQHTGPILTNLSRHPRGVGCTDDLPQEAQFTCILLVPDPQEI